MGEKDWLVMISVLATVEASANGSERVVDRVLRETPSSVRGLGPIRQSSRYHRSRSLVSP